jgi:cell division protein FtsW (lipid II flippase)
MLIVQFLVFIFLGLFLWFINKYFAMSRKSKNFLNTLIVIGSVAWLLVIFGFFRNF